MVLKLTFIFCRVVLLLIISVPVCFSQNCSFTGAGDNNNWSNSANWSCNTIPNASSDTVIIPTGKEVDLTTNENFNGERVLIVYGKIKGNNNSLFFANNSQSAFYSGSEIDDLFEIKLEGKAQLTIDEGVELELKDLSVTNNSTLITNSDECIKIEDKFGKDLGATITGSGCMKFNGEEEEFKNNGDGNIFNCLDPNYSSVINRPRCSSFESNLVAIDDEVCLGEDGKANVFVLSNDLLDSTPIKNSEVTDFRIISEPNYGTLGTIPSGNRKVPYNLNSGVNTDLIISDSFVYEIEDVLGNTAQATVYIHLGSLEIEKITDTSILTIGTSYNLDLSEQPLDELIIITSSNLTTVKNDNGLALSIEKINTQATLEIISSSGSMCEIKDVYTIYFEENLIVDAGQDFSIKHPISNGELDAFSNLGTGTWTTESGIEINDINNPKSPFNVSGSATEYKLTWEVITPGGQTGSDFVTLFASTYRLPEAFSPNGDNINDVYEISRSSPDMDVKLNVYNRWGQLIFSSDDYMNDSPWEGKDENGNDLPEDTYMLNVVINDTKETVAVLLKR